MTTPAGGAGVSDPRSYWKTATAKKTTASDAAVAVADKSVVIPLPMIIRIPLERLIGAIKKGKAIGGSTGARKIKYNGTPYIFKSGRPANVINEYAAFLLYKAAGARVPDAYLVIKEMDDGDVIPVGVLIQYIHGKTVAEILMKELMTRSSRALMLDSLRDQFIFHALFANWDAKNSLNHMIPALPDGTLLFKEPYAIDLGGAMFYRAMGDPKMDFQFVGLSLPELDTIPAESADSTSKIYAELTNEDSLHGAICRAMRREVSPGVKAIQDERIVEMATQLVPLMRPFIHRAEDLPNTLFARFALLADFCRRGSLIEDIKTYATYHEIGMTAPPRVSAKVAALGKNYRKILNKGLEKAATRPLLMHGKRTAAPTPRIHPNNLGNVLIPTRSNSTPDSVVVNYMIDNINSIKSASEPIIPPPQFATKLTSINPRLRESLLAMRMDPAITKWLEEQVSFVSESLSKREHDVLVAYTRYGDRFVNNYCRGTLTGNVDELMMHMLLGGDFESGYAYNVEGAMGPINTSKMSPHQKVLYYWNSDIEIQDNPCVLAFGIVDQLSSLTSVKDLTLSLEWMREKGVSVPMGWKPQTGGLKYPDGSYVKKEDFLLEDGSINMRLIRLLLKDNFNYFSYAPRILTFLEQYKQELDAVLARAPKAPMNFTVFRGIESEGHLSDLTFKTADFLSTSLSPQPVIQSFTRKMRTDDVTSRTYHCCVYELTVRRDVPCVFLEPITLYQGEYEILIAPGMLVSLGTKIHLKLHVPSTRDIRGQKDELLREHNLPDREYASVVEGVVRPTPMSSIAAPAPVFEMGSFEDVTALKKLHSSTAAWARKPEMYSAAKPRGMRLSKKLRRKMVPSWKLRRKTRRSGSSH